MMVGDASPPLCCGGCGLIAPLGGQEKEEEEEARRPWSQKPLLRDLKRS